MDDQRTSTTSRHCCVLAQTISASPRQQRFPTRSGLFVDGFVVSRGEIAPFGSDASWTVTAASVVPGPHPVPHAAIILTHMTSTHDALPLKQAMAAVLPLTYTAKQTLTFALVLLGTTSALYTLWMGSSRLLDVLAGGTLAEGGRMDALAHLPTLLALGTLYLLSFDVPV